MYPFMPDSLRLLRPTSLTKKVNTIRTYRHSCKNHTTKKARPLKKVRLPEHKKFTIIIQTPDAKQTGHGRALAGLLDIAGDCPDTDLSLHHDNYLYGEGGR